MIDTPSPNAEAVILSEYLIGRKPTEAQIGLYSDASHRIASSPHKTLSICLRHPSLLPYLDAHDAFFRPSSELRQRLYLMFSILEASPDFTELFLPRKRSPFYVVILAVLGIRAIFRLLVGTLYVKVRGI